MKDKHIKAYMKCAEAFAECSPAVRLKVGSVIVKNNRIISCGYNALAEHINGSCEEKEYMDTEYELWIDGFLDAKRVVTEYPYCDDRGRYKLITKPEVRHSEKNALIGLTKSSESSIGASMFCTHSCCYYCAVDIVDAGITTFYYKDKYRDDRGLEHLKSCGVEVIQLKTEEG